MKQCMKSGIKHQFISSKCDINPRNRNYKIKQFEAHKFLNGKGDQEGHF